MLAVFLLTSSSENVNANNSNSYVMESAFSEFTVWILYGSFAVIASVGVLVLAFLPAAKQPEAAKDETTTNLAQISECAMPFIDAFHTECPLFDDFFFIF